MDKNTANIVKKANARMQLLRKVVSFGASENDLKTVYISFIRSLLEQSATVWNSSLTQKNIEDLERIQKTAFKVILQNKYKNYRNALNKLEMSTLVERREELCLNFAIKCTKHKHLQKMFPKYANKHEMKSRNTDVFEIQYANTWRLQRSPIIYMQKLLNENETRNNDHET